MKRPIGVRRELGRISRSMNQDGVSAAARAYLRGAEDALRWALDDAGEPAPTSAVVLEDVPPKAAA